METKVSRPRYTYLKGLANDYSVTRRRLILFNQGSGFPGQSRCPVTIRFTSNATTSRSASASLGFHTAYERAKLLEPVT